VWSESAHGKPESYRVVELSADFVMLDGNHPLAGQDLIFDIEAVEARDATAEEIAESLPADSSRLNYH
jgi:FKBP-type peptidyl-prolyl cis-trans isomerase SlyD